MPFCWGRKLLKTEEKLQEQKKRLNESANPLGLRISMFLLSLFDFRYCNNNKLEKKLHLHEESTKK